MKSQEYHISRNGYNVSCKLYYEDKKAVPGVVLFGHTHAPHNEYDSGRLYLNPGAACDGRFSILRIQKNGDLYAEMY